MTVQVLSPAEAAALIEDGQTITTSGFLGAGVPDVLLGAIRARFAAEAAPRGLTVLFAAGQGDGGERGLNHLGADGLLARAIGGHWGMTPVLGRAAMDGRIAGYNLPQGVISQMFRDIAAGRPGTLSHVGLGTFVDPRLEGGRIHPSAPDGLVSLVEIAGQEMLFYRAQPIDVALLRGTTADEDGNITMEREAVVLDNLAQAMAARNSGGRVIVQVESLAAAGSLSPRAVQIPAALVDAVVVAPEGAHPQTYGAYYSAPYAGAIRAPARAATHMALTPRKIIARRAAMELCTGDVVNLGIGMPEGVAAVAAEEGLLDQVTLTAEPGIIGGQPASGMDFGAGTNCQAIIAQNQQFDFYDGGGLDLAVLGMAEMDAGGDVNVSRFSDRLAGAGGFINISQNARRLVFAGTFTAGGLDIEVAQGRCHLRAEGRVPKFIDKVQQITFSGARARQAEQPVLVVTERAVFELRGAGLHLTEVAPGINLQRDILDQMRFAPIVERPRPMAPQLFREAPMGLALGARR